jgi:transposase
MKQDEFAVYLQDLLIPALREKYGDRRIVIVMDNCSAHTNLEVELLLEAAGYTLRYLPPYSPDFNPIELVFSVLKAWIKRWFCFKRPGCANFEDFLRLALQ